MADKKQGWRSELIVLLKAKMAAETDEQELKDMANVMSSLVPYEPEPVPYMEVPPSKRWGRKGASKK